MRIIRIPKTIFQNLLGLYGMYRFYKSWNG